MQALPCYLFQCACLFGLCLEMFLCHWILLVEIVHPTWILRLALHHQVYLSHSQQTHQVNRMELLQMQLHPAGSRPHPVLLLTLILSVPAFPQLTNC